jgi:hypothetical protein
MYFSGLLADSTELHLGRLSEKLCTVYVSTLRRNCLPRAGLRAVFFTQLINVLFMSHSLQKCAHPTAFRNAHTLQPSEMRTPYSLQRYIHSLQSSHTYPPTSNSSVDKLSPLMQQECINLKHMRQLIHRKLLPSH